MDEGDMMANTIPEKYRTNIVTDLPREVQIGGHHHPTPCWITSGMFPGVGFQMAGHEVSGSVGKPHAAPHTHDVPEIWVAPSERKGTLMIEAQMDDDKFLVEAPFSIFIPSGTRHCFTVVKCESPHYIMGIILLDWRGP
jgi:hypothetical protein